MLYQLSYDTVSRTFPLFSFGIAKIGNISFSANFFIKFSCFFEIISAKVPLKLPSGAIPGLLYGRGSHVCRPQRRRRLLFEALLSDFTPPHSPDQSKSLFRSSVSTAATCFFFSLSDFSCSICASECRSVPTNV